MTKIQEQSNKIQSYLDEYNKIIDENIGTSNRWKDDSENRFKSKWYTFDDGFQSFVKLINDNVDILVQTLAGQSKLDSTDFIQ